MVVPSDSNGGVNNDNIDMLAQLKCGRSSTHSTAPLADSITASEFEYGNDSKTDINALNESLSNWDAVLQTKHTGGRAELLNGSCGSLTKAASVRDFEGVKPIYARRRSSVHGYTPSIDFNSFDGHTSFRSEFKASVDDWNSELPVEFDDEITESFSQLNASLKSTGTSDKRKKSSKSKRVETVDGVQSLHGSFPDNKLPERKTSKAKSSKSLHNNDILETDTGSGQSVHLDASRPLTRSLLPPPKSTRQSKNRTGPPVVKTGSIGKLEARFARSVQTIRGGMSFRSGGSTNSNSSISKSEHIQKKKLTSIEGVSASTEVM